MLVKNRRKLERNHPNFENDMDVISVVADVMVIAKTSDLIDVAKSVTDEDYSFDIKYFFLSSQPKEINVRDSTGQLAMSLLYAKDGFEFTTNIYDNKIISELAGSDVLDKITIFQMEYTRNGYYEVGFNKEGLFSGNAVFSVDDGEPVLDRYELNWD